MPYITDEEKLRFIPALNELFGVMELGTTPGDLNYLFTRIAHEYIRVKGLRYVYLNDVVGALDGAKVEFQRRVVAPYEDKKIALNGDVYGV